MASFLTNSQLIKVCQVIVALHRSVNVELRTEYGKIAGSRRGQQTLNRAKIKYQPSASHASFVQSDEQAHTRSYRIRNVRLPAKATATIHFAFLGYFLKVTNET